jgi:dihydroneopterin aldolase
MSTDAQDSGPPVSSTENHLTSTYGEMRLRTAAETFQKRWHLPEATVENFKDCVRSLFKIEFEYYQNKIHKLQPKIPRRKKRKKNV